MTPAANNAHPSVRDALRDVLRVACFPARHPDYSLLGFRVYPPNLPSKGGFDLHEHFVTYKSESTNAALGARFVLGYPRSRAVEIEFLPFSCLLRLLFVLGASFVVGYYVCGRLKLDFSFSIVCFAYSYSLCWAHSLF